MSFYRPPVNPGWDDFGARIQQGVTTGIGLMMEGGERRRAAARQAAQDRIAADDRNWQRQMQDAEMGVVPESDAYETVPHPSLSTAATGTGSPEGQWQGEQHDLPATFDMGTIARGTAAPPATAVPMERRLRQGVVRVGGLFIDPSQSLAYRRSVAQTQAEHDLADADRERKLSETRMALVAAGVDPQEAARRAAAAAYGITLPQTPEEIQAITTARMSAEEPFRRADDDRTLQRTLTALAARGNGGGGGTPSQRRADRNEDRKTAEDTAYRLIQNDPTISPQEVLDYLRRTDVIGRNLAHNDLDNAITGAQSRYAREHGSGAMGQIQEEARDTQSARRNKDYRRRMGYDAAPGSAAAQGGQRPNSGRRRKAPPATSSVAAAGRNGQKTAITQGEYSQLRARGFSDQEIRARHQVH